MDVHHRIRDIFDSAIDLPRDRRADFLLEQCGDNLGLYEEVARLIDAYEANLETQDDLAIGRLIGFGAYEIVRELGRGGMGAVYLARRVDGTFDRQVAVKVVRTDKVADTAVERFNRERKLLARIQHPGIATLYDAGSTEDGMPYFVMEYVDGLTVTDYCDRNRLPLRSRVMLFQQICDAVACAHRVPIIHCDLKPGNILVDADGHPRVLDFGIATALTRGGQEADPPLDPFGSPRYASPEQLRGEPLQTTADIYSLGVILHELLVGQPPPVSSGTGPSMMFPTVAQPDRTTGRVEIPLQIADLRGTTTDTLRTEVAGDLDAIVSKCLKTAPARRYATVDALRDDLQRWLDHRPVSARPQTVAYVASRFIRRNSALVTAAGLALLFLVVGTAVVTYEWRKAEAARQVAERRFNDVRQLATSLFDVDTQLTNVAATMEARQTIVENASQYLDRLSRDAANDATLSLELAESYRRVGDMLGNPNAANLGRGSEALQKFDIAASHLAVAAQQRPENPEVKLADARLRTSRGDVLLAQRAWPDARHAYEQSATTVQALLKNDPDNVPLLRMLAGIYRPLGEVHVAQGNTDEALKIFEKARAIDLRLLARHPEDPEAQRLLALSQFRIGQALAVADRKAEAIDAFAEASKILGALSAQYPARVSLARDVALGRMNLARLALENGDASGRAEMQHAVDTFRSLARLDPRNVAATRDLLAALVAAGDVAVQRDARAARANYLEALRIAEMLHAEPLGDAQAERDIRVVHARLDAPAARSTIPELKLAVVRNGQEVVVDKTVGAAALGEDLRLSLGTSGAEAQYLLVMGGTGRASLFSRDEVAAAGWRVKTSGPPPSETVLLLTLPRTLADEERTALIERVSRTSGPRQIPPDAHIIWRTHQPETIETSATARGVVDIEWTAAVRAELESIPGLRFSGRTLPVAFR